MHGKTAAITSKAQSTSYRKQFGRATLVTLVGVLLAGVCNTANVCGRAIAATPPSGSEPSGSDSAPQPDLEPLDLEALKPGHTPTNVVTVNSISLTHLTVPSLWWLKDQISDEDTYGRKLISNWLAYPKGDDQPGRVDLVVNRQFWSLLNYLDRYAFIHAFGKAARDYGYNLRVFDGQATQLGASTCNFSTISIDALKNRNVSRLAASGDRAASDVPLPLNPVDTIPCSISLESSGKGVLRGGSSPFSGGGAAKGLDTVRP